MKLPSDKLVYHTDWIWPFCWIKRKFTEHNWKIRPKIICGNRKTYQAIPDPGEWFISYPPYFTVRARSGWSIHFIFRFDENAQRWEFPSFKIGFYK